MNSWLRAVHLVWLLGVFLPTAVALTALGALLVGPVRLVAGPAQASRWVAGSWARLVAWLTPVRVNVEGGERADAQRSFIVVCNHESMYDIPVVYGFSGLDMRWVMKRELRRVPAIGIGCRMLGHVFIDRSDRRAANAAIRAAAQRLDQGIGMIFFPEGTRSGSDEMLPFKLGAFRLAIENELPVLPMTVVGTRRILPRGHWLPRPGRARLVIHEPVPTHDLARDDAPALASRVRAIIDSARKRSSQRDAD